MFPVVWTAEQASSTRSLCRHLQGMDPVAWMGDPKLTSEAAESPIDCESSDRRVTDVCRSLSKDTRKVSVKWPYRCWRSQLHALGIRRTQEMEHDLPATIALCEIWKPRRVVVQMRLLHERGRTTRVTDKNGRRGLRFFDARYYATRSGSRRREGDGGGLQGLRSARDGGGRVHCVERVESSQ